MSRGGGIGRDAREGPVRQRYTKELLEGIAKDCVSVAGVLRKLGVAQAGGTHAHISRKLKAFQIDISHFLGQGANRGPNHKGSQKLPWQQVLILRTQGWRQKAHVLRRALLESGRTYSCEGLKCPVEGTWLGKPLILHVDHKNGNWLDDRPDNLELLCPNCHCQTPNYCGSKGLSDRISVARQSHAYRLRKKGPVVEQADT